MKRPEILSLGEVLWDVFPDGERFGGAPANFACHAAILGANVAMVSAVGDDQHGREALAILRGYDIDVSLMQVLADAPTGSVSVSLDAEAKPTYTIHEGSAWDRLAWNSELESRIDGADAVYFGTLGQRSEGSRTTIRQAVETARDAEIPRILDINLRSPFFDSELIRESVQRASILKLSDEERPHVCEACGIRWMDSVEYSLKQLLEWANLDSVVMTRGANGALLVTPDGIRTQPGIPTTVRDTVGAGDAFTGAFLLGLLRNQPPDVILLEACTIAAAVCSHSGAVPNKPTNSD